MLTNESGAGARTASAARPSWPLPACNPDLVLGVPNTHTHIHIHIHTYTHTYFICVHTQMKNLRARNRNYSPKLCTVYTPMYTAFTVHIHTHAHIHIHDHVHIQIHIHTLS